MPDEELIKIKNNSFEKGKMYTSSSLTKYILNTLLQILYSNYLFIFLEA